jgi:hypothetical protein
MTTTGHGEARADSRRGAEPTPSEALRLDRTPRALAVFGAALDLVAGARPLQLEREKR